MEAKDKTVNNANNDTNVLLNSNWTSSFGNENGNVFGQDSSTHIPPGFDTSTDKPTDDFELLFMAEMINETVTRTIVWSLRKMKQ